ncbi:exported hypothetical protein [Cupriavidus taiwanensis]|nr:exported hypothetical protein [Cupriavidus taiwanensis]
MPPSILMLTRRLRPRVKYVLGASLIPLPELCSASQTTSTPIRAKQ